jgi:hypothetical protein
VIRKAGYHKDRESFGSRALRSKESCSGAPESEICQEEVNRAAGRNRRLRLDKRAKLSLARRILALVLDL